LQALSDVDVGLYLACLLFSHIKDKHSFL